MMIPSVARYIAEINMLKKKYAGKIKILCGVEQDYYSNFSRIGFDYVIGSVHYIKVENDFFPIDLSKDALIEIRDKHFGGDMYALIEEYYKCVGDVVLKTDADIIGHFDLISKFNEDGSLFDEDHPRYVKAYTDAIDRLIPYDKPFEVNTGAISRGYRTHPYPSRKQLEYIAKCGGFVTLTGDTHQKENLCFEFEKWYEECEKIGVNYRVGNILSSDMFYDDADSGMQWAKMGVLGVEMESAALYCNAARAGKKALCICTVSDSFIYPEENTTAEERQISFTKMMEIALNLAEE